MVIASAIVNPKSNCKYHQKSLGACLTNPTIQGASFISTNMLRYLDEDIRRSIFENAFNASSLAGNPLLQALRRDQILYHEALNIFYSIKRVVMKMYYGRFVGRPLPTSVKTLGYVRNLSIKHISFHSETHSSHVLEGVELLKLLPSVDDLKYAHYGDDISPVGPVRMMVETFRLNRLRLEFAWYKSSASKLEKMETCLGLTACGAKISIPFRKAYIWEVKKGNILQWREGGHIDDLDDLDAGYLDADV